MSDTDAGASMDDFLVDDDNVEEVDDEANHPPLLDEDEDEETVVRHAAERSVLNADAETRMMHVLRFAERLARGMSNFEAVEVAAVQRLQSNLLYLAPQAAAGWTPAFRAVIQRCHSIRVADIPPDQKFRLRRSARCSACGRHETDCMYRVDMLLGVEPNAWSAAPEVLPESWKAFHKAYFDLYDDAELAASAEATGVGDVWLPSSDGGTVVVGFTCLRKLELYFSLRVLLLDIVCEAHAAIEHHSDATLRDANFFPLWDVADAVEERTEQLHELEVAVADEKAPLPDVPVDEKMWKRVDAWRAQSAGENARRLDDALGARSRARLRELAPSPEQDCEDEEGNDELGGEEDDDADVDAEVEEEAHDAAPRRRRRQSTRGAKRRVVVDDDCDDSDDEGRRRERRQRRAQRGRSAPEGEEAATTDGGADTSTREAIAAQLSAAVELLRRRSPENDVLAKAVCGGAHAALTLLCRRG